MSSDQSIMSRISFYSTASKTSARQELSSRFTNGLSMYIIERTAARGRPDVQYVPCYIKCVERRVACKHFYDLTGCERHGGLPYPYLESLLTIPEAAKFLFVSRPHVRKLLECGALNEALPKRPDDEPNIELQSVLEYQVKRDAAARSYQELGPEN